MTDRQPILGVVQTDLQLICSMRSVLEDSGLASLAVARNSEEAILYLRGVGIYADRKKYPLPTIVLLDCANPNSGDLEVLGWIREQSEFREMPVIMLCADGEHLRVSCALDSSCLLVERGDMRELADAVGTLEAAQIYAATAA